MTTWLTVIFFACTGAALVLQSLRAPEKERGVVVHYWTLPLEIATSLLVVGVSAWDFVAGGGTGWFYLLAGLVVFAAGTALFRGAQEELGRYWSLHIELRAHQPLITHGVYAVRRHPAYLGLILEVAAFPVALASWRGFLLLLFTFVPVVLVRMWLEERVLERRFGEAYSTYKRATPPFGSVDPGWRRAAPQPTRDEQAPGDRR